MTRSKPEREWNLLTEPILRVVTDQGTRHMNLPELMSLLGRDEIHHYEGIQRHQEDAFHVFLSYLAGAILARQNLADPVQSEEFWRQGMRDLTQGIGDDAWSLIVNDFTRPAFMQPPIPLKTMLGLNRLATTTCLLKPLMQWISWLHPRIMM